MTADSDNNSTKRVQYVADKANQLHSRVCIKTQGSAGACDVASCLIIISEQCHKCEKNARLFVKTTEDRTESAG